MSIRREPDRIVKIVALQAGLAHSAGGNPGTEANFSVLADHARAAFLEASPDLIAFPEYALAGWPYPPEHAMNALAEEVPGDGPWFQRYVELARETGTALLCWLLETDSQHLYNTGFILDPQGAFVGKYSKVQANLGEQTWFGWSQGDSFQPIEHDGVRYGISICADMWFPETVRCEELLGADVIIHQSIADDMEHIVPTRAFDSEIPIVMSVFNGGSYAVDSRGNLLGKLDRNPSGWIAFDLQPFRIRTHRKYGGLWIPKLGNHNLRNVAAYEVLGDPATRPPWTDVFLSETGEPQSREQLLQRFGGRWDADDPSLYHTPLVSFDPPWTSPFRVDPAHPHHLVNGQGEHLFIVNKTAWAYFGCSDPSGVLHKARDIGANVLRVALEGVPYWDQLGIDLWPWGGTRQAPDWSTINEAYWDRVEERVRMAGKMSIGLDLVLYMQLHAAALDVPLQRPYWEEALRRLGRYANILTWEIQNEYTANEGFQDAAGAFFHQHDPYHRPACSSAGTTDDAIWPDKAWMDLAINHTCTSSTEQHDLRGWYLALARNARSHGKPAFCNESGREQRHGNDDGVHRRKQGWLWCASGGFWTWHSWDGCEGIDDLGYRAPGEEFVLPMSWFFQCLPFWRLAPNHTTLVVHYSDLLSAVLAEPDRSLVIGYVCAPTSGASVDDAQAWLRLPDGEYRIAFVSPSDLSTLSTQAHRSPGLRTAIPIELPSFRDDLAIKVERTKRSDATPIPGTQ